MNRYLIALVATALPGLGFAQTTPQAVLDEWLAFDAALPSVAFQYETTQSSPGFIRLAPWNMTLGFEFPGMAVSEAITMDWVELRANDDGTVTISMADSIAGAITTAQDMGDIQATSDATITVNAAHGSMVVSGAPGAHVYTVAYPEITTEMVQTTLTNGQSLTTTQQQTMRGVHSTMTVTGGPLGIITVSGVMDGGTLHSDQQIEPGQSMTMDGTFGATAMDARINMAFMAAQPVDFGAMDLAAKFTLADTQMLLSASVGLDMTFDFASFGVDFTLNPVNAAIAVDMGATSVGGAVQAMPLAFDFDGFSYAVSLPLGPRDTLGEARFNVHLQNLIVTESIMSLFDPTNALGRYGLSAQLDALGRMQPPFDLGNMAALDRMGPPEIESGTVTFSASYGDLAVAASGEGVNQGGVPVGQLSARAANLSEFLNKLTQIGLLQPQQNLMAQGMLGMMAAPGTTPNALQTSIEMRPDGTVWVNGQPMP